MLERRPPYENMKLKTNDKFFWCFCEADGHTRTWHARTHHTRKSRPDIIFSPVSCLFCDFLGVGGREVHAETKRLLHQTAALCPSQSTCAPHFCGPFMYSGFFLSKRRKLL